jgi:hypothetical protein
VVQPAASPASAACFRGTRLATGSARAGGGDPVSIRQGMPAIETGGSPAKRRATRQRVFRSYETGRASPA